MAAVLGEAEWLGVTGRGAISSAGRALLDGRSDADLAAAMQPHLPEPVEHVLLQADLTAIAPGPLAGGLATFMRLVADVESRGGATVYRFNQDSVRRALDAGWSVDQVLGALGDASHTPIPQPLEYLIRDVARRHGQARVGAMRAYIRCDDEATLGAMVADRELSPLQLRSIAPTILVSPVAAETVLEFLRENGFAPAAETPDGGIIVPTTGAHRTPLQRRPTPVTAHTVDDELVTDDGRRPARRARRRRHTSASRWRADPDPASRAPTRPRRSPSSVTRRRIGRRCGSATPTPTDGSNGCCSTPTGSRAGGCTAPQRAPAARCRSTASPAPSQG